MSDGRFGRVCGSVSAAATVAAAAYALLVLQPLAKDNHLMRVSVADFEASAARVAALKERIAVLQRDLREEAPSYWGVLRSLHGWKVEAHAHVSRLAADAGLEATAMEWTEAKPVTPAFKADPHKQWWRTGVALRLSGAWRAHREFARELSRCECLVQVIEKKVTASGRTGLVEALLSLVIYHPGEEVRV